MFNSDYYVLMIIMADQMFMFATTAGFMIGLGIILGIARTRRSRTVTTEATNESSFSSSSSGESGGTRRSSGSGKTHSGGTPPQYQPPVEIPESGF